ncbi:MAG TPA: imidazole glycerol phosphate synthase subunit HisF, partial [Firmicutes bacterium]|nr:imidazole glycerol phosphate synthase subunit HisF [Bacillota bacterium]
DELVFLAIAAAREQRKTLLEMVAKIAQKISIPFTVGGGVSTVAGIEELLAAGADKISINSAAVKNPELLSTAVSRVGSQRLVLAVDAKRRGLAANEGWEVYINGGLTPTGLDVLEWVTHAEKLGVGELLVTSMDTDGTKDGYDYELLRAVRDQVKMPVIASGGAGKLEHLRDAVLKGKADAVLAASIFHFQTYTIHEVKDYLASAGIAVRM